MEPTVRVIPAGRSSETLSRDGEKNTFLDSVASLREGPGFDPRVDRGRFSVWSSQACSLWACAGFLQVLRFSSRVQKL